MALFLKMYLKPPTCLADCFTESPPDLNKFVFKDDAECHILPNNPEAECDFIFFPVLCQFLTHKTRIA